MLSRFTVMVCLSIAVVGGKLRFLSGRRRDFWHSIFHHSFCFLGANFCNRFYDCSSFGRVFFLWEWVFSFLFKSGWFRSWSWEFLLTRHCSHCLVKNKGGCSFGLFNYDSFVSFRAIGVIWGIRELTAELVCLLFWHSSLSLPCGGLYGTDNQRHENHLYVDCPGVGQVARGLRTDRSAILVVDELKRQSADRRCCKRPSRLRNWSVCTPPTFARRTASELITVHRPKPLLSSTGLFQESSILHILDTQRVCSAS